MDSLTKIAADLRRATARAGKMFAQLSAERDLARALRAMRDAEIHKRLDNGVSVEAIAKKARLTPQQVWNIKKNGGRAQP